MTMTFTLYGTLQQKGNSRRIFRSGKTGRPIMVKSAAANALVNDFLSQLAKFKHTVCADTVLPIMDAVSLTATIYYPNLRHDLEASLLCDILQKGGIIGNDRQIKEMHLYHALDRNKPRAEVSLKTI